MQHGSRSSAGIHSAASVEPDSLVDVLRHLACRRFSPKMRAYSSTGQHLMATAPCGMPHGSENPYPLGDQFPDSVRDETYNQSRSRPMSVGSVR